MGRWLSILKATCLAISLVWGAVSRDQTLPYNEDLARLCVVYSSAAYARVTEWNFTNPACNNKTEGFVLSETFIGEHTDAFGYVGVDPVGGRIVVAFKGTSDLKDWMTDLRTWVRYTKRCAPGGEPATVSPSSSRSEMSGPGLPPPSPREPQRRRGQRQALEGGSGSGAAESVPWEANRGGGGGGGGGRQVETEEDASGVAAEEDATAVAAAGGGSDVSGLWLEGSGHFGFGEELSAVKGGRVADPYPVDVLEERLGEDAGRWGQLRTHRWPQQQQRWQETGRQETWDQKGALEGGQAGNDAEPTEPTGEDELIGNVHFGFCEYYQTLVAKGLADKVLELAADNPKYRILVTGHSLGAAAAAVCAADLVQRLGLERDRVVLYTLGEPRTGDGVFAEGLNDRVGTAYRVVHNRDVVPHLALCCHGWLGKCKEGESSCPYQHSTEIVYADDMGQGAPFLICNNTIGEDYACDPRAWDLSVSDHQHYFEMPVGLYCGEAPEELPPSPVALERERAHWAPYDAKMREEDNPFRLAGGLWDA